VRELYAVVFKNELSLRDKRSTYLHCHFSSLACKGNVNLLHLSVSICQFTAGFLRRKKIPALCHILERRSTSTRGGTVEECHKVADLGGKSLP
jgi:hypothetical protein